MPLLVDLLVAAAMGVLVVCATWLWRRISAAPRPALSVARWAGEGLGSHPRLRVLLLARIDHTTATGLALTAALVSVLATGVALGVLVYLIRTVPAVNHADNAAAWGYEHRTAFSTGALRLITDAGAPDISLALAALLVALLVLRHDRWSALFLVCAVAGTELVTTTVKDLASRARPTLDPWAV